MQSKTLLAVCVSVVAILAIVSGKLWLDLRSARQQNVEQQGQPDQGKIAVVQSAPAQPPPPTIEAPPVPAAAVQPPESRPLPLPAALPLPAPLPPPAPRAVAEPAPERPLGMPTLTRPLEGNTDEERRLDALVQSDLAARARVTRWSTSLNLTPEQRQALDAITITELRRETEESLQLASIRGAIDAASIPRIKEETINRQSETSQRILQLITPQLTAEQVENLRAQFEAGHASRLASLRAEREQAALSGR